MRWLQSLYSIPVSYAIALILSLMMVWSVAGSNYPQDGEVSSLFRVAIVTDSGVDVVRAVNRELEAYYTGESTEGIGSDGRFYIVKQGDVYTVSMTVSDYRFVSRYRLHNDYVTPLYHHTWGRGHVFAAFAYALFALVLFRSAVNILLFLILPQRRVVDRSNEWE
uniref:hypothetical protein n=1 Tax=Thaumasiovibrio occultus TaxID=1891184 RepID=UPI000B360ADF|nr:hypothetical protein [Thaumasiovibrio occultus]